MGEVCRAAAIQLSCSSGWHAVAVLGLPAMPCFYPKLVPTRPLSLLAAGAAARCPSRRPAAVSGVVRHQACQRSRPSAPNSTSARSQEAFCEASGQAPARPRAFGRDYGSAPAAPSISTRWRCIVLFSRSCVGRNSGAETGSPLHARGRAALRKLRMCAALDLASCELGLSGVLHAAGSLRNSGRGGVGDPQLRWRPP